MHFRTFSVEIKKKFRLTHSSKCLLTRILCLARNLNSIFLYCFGLQSGHWTSSSQTYLFLHFFKLSIIYLSICLCVCTNMFKILFKATPIQVKSLAFLEIPLLPLWKKEKLNLFIFNDVELIKA